MLQWWLAALASATTLVPSDSGWLQSWRLPALLAAPPHPLLAAAAASCSAQWIDELQCLACGGGEDEDQLLLCDGGCCGGGRLAGMAGRVSGVGCCLSRLFSRRCPAPPRSAAAGSLLTHMCSDTDLTTDRVRPCMPHLLRRAAMHSRGRVVLPALCSAAGEAPGPAPAAADARCAAAEAGAGGGRGG